MRCFIAIDISNPNTLENLARIANLFNLTGVKPVEKENLHITLKFLGEISEKTVQELITKLDEVKYKQFEVRVASIGAFPNLRRPRVIWAGIKEGHQELIQLQSIIENALKDLKLRMEDEKFHPHVTLARIKDNRSMMQVLEIINSNLDQEFGKFEVKDFVLKQSTLTSRGPIYSDIKRFNL